MPPILHIPVAYAHIFSERELTFTIAICYRPSVCRLSVCNRDGHETSMAETDTLASRDRDVDNFRRDETLIRLETVSRPRRRDRDDNPVCNTRAPYTQPAEIFENAYTPWPSADIHCKFYTDRRMATPPSGDARGVTNYSDFGHIEGHVGNGATYRT